MVIGLLYLLGLLKKEEKCVIRLRRKDRQKELMTMKRSVTDLKELGERKVFLRVELNVPLDENHRIINDTMIRASIPTIKCLIYDDAKVILTSHLVAPDKGHLL